MVDGIGNLPGQVDELVAKAGEARKQLSFSVDIEPFQGGVRVSSETAETEGHEVWLVRYVPGNQEVKVGKGPNKGKKVRHTNVVRELTRLGEWRGGVLDLVVPEPGAGAGSRAVFVQGSGMGGVVGVVKL